MDKFMRLSGGTPWFPLWAVDLTVMLYKWILPLTEKMSAESEGEKGAFYHLPNPLYPENHIIDILRAEREYDHVLIPTAVEVICSLQEGYGQKVLLCYPEDECRGEYRERFIASGLQANVTWIRGDHEQWLADHIYLYYGTPEKKRKGIRPYRYNSFDLMKQRLVEKDMLDLADLIMRLPLQVELEIGTTKYLLAHAMTFDLAEGKQKPEAYMERVTPLDDYHHNGVNGYVSMVGHMDSAYMCRENDGEYLDGMLNSIWRNNKEELVCLETGERFYV